MVSRERIRGLRRLHRRKDRDAAGLFLAEGVRVVNDLLDSGLPLREAVVSPGLVSTPGGVELARRLAAHGPVHQVSDGQLAGIAATETPQGVVVAAARPDRSLADVAGPDARALLILDGVQDPGNVGTLVRTAEALGADGVALAPGTADAWNPKAVRAAAGSLFRLPVVAAQWDALLDRVRAGGFTIYAADAAGLPPERLRPFRLPAALVVGNEGAGLSGRARGSADAFIAVPLRGRAESLSVGAAAAILIYLILEGI